MRYKKFIINGYRGFKDIVEINLSRESLIPIIGKNESGKTTCLEAILAFDYNNDEQYNGKHLENIENLYSTEELPIKVSAVIEFEDFKVIEKLFQTEIDSFKDEYLFNHPDETYSLQLIDFETSMHMDWQYAKGLQVLTSTEKNKTIQIDRDLRTRKYFLQILSGFIDIESNHLFTQKIVKALPYILYFDDFRDRIPEKIFITDVEEDPSYSNWIEYIDELFKKTKSSYSVYDLTEKKDSIRRSIIKEVQNFFNKKLLEEWSKYQFEQNENITIEIDYESNGENPYLHFKIVEKVLVDGNLEDRYFDISDRSKGFYWYINFMIKLNYNPNKRDVNDKDTIYLLDEPGSYLHTYALNKLAQQLKNLSVENKVIFCTHSHNLLNPDFIPLNAIRLAEKGNEGKVTLKVLDYKGIIRPKKYSAYQAIFDALEVRPPLSEFSEDNIILLEGIYDYYSFKMFTDNKLNYFPCASASTIVNQIPFMIFLGKKYIALWDNDKIGRESLKKAVETYGPVEGKKFITLDQISNNSNTILENYYDKSEIEKYSGLTNLTKSAFCSTVLELYYNPNRKNLIKKSFPKTIKNFESMEKKLLEIIIP